MARAKPLPHVGSIIVITADVVHIELEHDSWRDVATVARPSVAPAMALAA